MTEDEEVECQICGKKLKNQNAMNTKIMCLCEDCLNDEVEMDDFPLIL